MTFNLKLQDNALDSIYGCEHKNSNGPHVHVGYVSYLFMSIFCT